MANKKEKLTTSRLLAKLSGGKFLGTTPTVVPEDPFTGGDDDPVDPGKWNEVPGQGKFKIKDNTAVGIETGDNQMIYIGSFENDQWASCTVCAATGSAGPVVRGTKNEKGGYVARVDGTTLYITKLAAGGNVDLGNTTISAITPLVSVIKIEAIGDTIKAYIDGSEQLSVTDSTYKSGSAGIWTVGTTECVDDFLGGNASGTAVLWTPADMELAFWYDMSDEANVTEGGGKVTQMTDLSGNGLHAYQSNTALQATLVRDVQNGLPVLRLASSSYSIDLDTSQNKGLSIFLVGNFTTNSITQYFMDGQIAREIFAIRNTNVLGYYDGTWRDGTEVQTSGLNIWSIKKGYLGDPIKLRANGEALTNAPAYTAETYFDSGWNICFFSSYATTGNYVVGDVYALIGIWDGASDESFERLEGYYNDLYGMNVLPVDHTYYGSPAEKTTPITVDEFYPTTWFDSTDNDTITLVDGTKVSVVTNKGTSGIDAIQPNDPKRPTLGTYAGKQTFLFDGVDDLLNIQDRTEWYNGKDYTVIALARRTSGGTYIYGEADANNNSQGIRILDHTDGKVYIDMFRGSTVYPRIVSNAFTVNTPRLVAVRYTYNNNDDSAFMGRVNGTYTEREGSVQTGGGSVYDGALGSNGLRNVTAYGGDIMAFVFFEGKALDMDQIIELEGILAHHHGIASEVLPTTHPFYSEPPSVSTANLHWSTFTGDNFDGTNGDPVSSINWTTENTSASGTVEIDTNQCRMDIPITANDEFIRLNSNFKVVGDFDITIDWTSTFDAPSSSTGYPARFVLEDSSGNTLTLARGITSTLNQFYAQETGEATGTVSTSLTTSKFRFTRTGSVLKGYIWRNDRWEWTDTDGWTWASTDTGPMSVQILTTADFDMGADTYWDNFSINTGTVIPA